MAKPNGRYKRLVESQRRENTVSVDDIKKDMAASKKFGEEDEEEIDYEQEELELASKIFNKADARNFAVPETRFFIIGAIGCVVAGGVFPAWGIVFAEMIGLLFYPVLPCNEAVFIPGGHQTCDEYYEFSKNEMKDMSFEIAGYWCCIIAACFIGNGLAFYGLGYANERINRNVRDKVFSSLMRQEVAFFDKRSVGSITSQLADDVSFVFAFSGEPVRTLVINLSSVVTGLTISMICE